MTYYEYALLFDLRLMVDLPVNGGKPITGHHIREAAEQARILLERTGVQVETLRERGWSTSATDNVVECRTNGSREKVAADMKALRILPCEITELEHVGRQASSLPVERRFLVDAAGRWHAVSTVSV